MRADPRTGQKHLPYLTSTLHFNAAVTEVVRSGVGPKIDKSPKKKNRKLRNRFIQDYRLDIQARGTANQCGKDGLFNKQC